MRTAALALLVMTRVASADEPQPAPDPTSPAPTPEPAPTPAPDSTSPTPTPVARPKPPAPTTPIEIELKPKAAHVLGEIPRPTQGKFATTQRDVSHVPAFVATGVTGALLLTTVLSYKHHKTLVGEIDELGVTGPATSIDEETRRRQERIDRADRWHTYWLGSAALTVIAGGASGFLWSRHENVPDGPVDPANPGYIWPIMNHPLHQRSVPPTGMIEVTLEGVRVAYSQQF